jgi:hypothetical protein
MQRSDAVKSLALAPLARLGARGAEVCFVFGGQRRVACCFKKRLSSLFRHLGFRLLHPFQTN